MSSKKMVTFNENVDVRSMSSDSDYEEAAPRADFDDGFVDFQHYGVEDVFQRYEVEDALQRYGVEAVFQRDEVDAVMQLYGVDKAVPEAVPEKDEDLSKPSTSKQAFQAVPKSSGPLVYDVPSGKQPMAEQPDRFATWRSLNKWDEDSDSDEPVDLSELYAELYGWHSSDEEGEVRAEVKEEIKEEVTIEDCDEDDDCEGTGSEEEDEEEEEEDKLRPQPILKYIVELGPEEYDEAKEHSLYANSKYQKFLLESGVELMKQKYRSEALNYWNQCVMNKHAWFNIGVAYEMGEYSDTSTEPNLVEAKKYYLRAAQKDHPLAVFNLALYYLYGKGPQQRDLNMAHFLMKKAMGLGVEQATEFYEELETQAAIEQLLEEERAQHLKD